MPRSRTVASGLRRTRPPSNRRQIRRKPFPCRGILSISGDTQTSTGECTFRSILRASIISAFHRVKTTSDSWEDDWESPTLGASGLGWEVWWNGAEVTQFTYFQQMGSIDLDPICAEITYGLERIALYLQDVDDFFDIRWNEHVNYGDVHRQSEVEYSTYNFERADVDMLFESFGTYEKETHACLDAGLVLPATDHVLKCSHTFNMLDARGGHQCHGTGKLYRARPTARATDSTRLCQTARRDGTPASRKWAAGADLYPDASEIQEDAPLRKKP